MTALTTLGLEQAIITPAGLEKIGKRFPKLEELSLLGCASVTDEGFEHLAVLRGLRRLVLRGTQVRGPGLARLNARNSRSSTSARRRPTTRHSNNSPASGN